MRALTLAFALAAGCGTTASSTTPVAAASADFTNAEGKLVCPVMGDVIATKEQAVGSEQFEGKTYWFCCDSCQRTFDSDPKRYAEGAFLTHLQAEHGGDWAVCSHPL